MSKDRQEAEVEERRRGRIKMAIWSGVIVVGIILFIILAKVVSAPAPTSSNGNTTGASPAPASLVKAVTTLPDSIFSTVGTGSVTTLPKLIQAPAITQGGKPRVVDISAEYCPYCAAERWPTVIALSRFGTFSNLQVSHSGSADVYPNTQTFSFYGVTYSSPYVVFDGKEIETNVASGSSYSTLETPTSEEQGLMNTYDAAPYVSASSAGSIPFIDFAGKYLISGASYSPALLQGQSSAQIAAALSDPKNPITQGIIGTANIITAAICTSTNNMPANVCANPTIQGIQTKLSNQ